MKTRFVFLPAILTLILSFPVFGQPHDDDPAKSNMQKHDMSSMMGKPTVDATAEGLHIQVWLMTQKEHKEMMEGNRDHMMMHGKKEGAMGQMEMKGSKDTSKGSGRDMNVVKLESLGKGEDVHVMKLEKLGSRKDKPALKPDSSGMRTDTKAMKHESMETKRSMMDSMMAGTHHLRLDVTDAASGKDIASASVTILIVSPSKKSSSVELKPMMNHFGGALTLDEKGAYQFAVSVNVSGVSKTTKFEYALK